MKWYAPVLILGLVLGSSAFVKRDAGAALFQSGKEYIYNYQATVSAGSKDFVGFSSVFNITALLHVQQNGNLINVKLDDIKFGAYNGEFSYADHPEYTLKAYPELEPLSKPFQVKVDHGKVKGIVLDDEVPEWAHNIKRGIASNLQLDLAQINFNQASSFTVDEDSIAGDCPTHYVVVPDVKVTHVRKYRQDSQCTDRPRQVRAPGIGVMYCPDDRSRDLLNSTAFGVYDLEMKDGSLVVTKIKHGSTIVFHPLGVDGHTQYSASIVYMSLKTIASGTVAGPAHAHTHQHVHFVFNQQVKEDEDLKKPTPFFFHVKDVELDQATQTKAVEQLKENIKKMADSLDSIAVYKDLKDFHKVSPFSIIPLVSNLDYDHLTQVLNELKAGDVTEYKLFLDALVVAGTGPASLVVRDVVAGTQETAIIARLIAPLANYVRHPTENLLKELEVLIKPENTKHNERIIEFAFASLLNRVCAKNGCQASGLLNKYVALWSSKIDSATHFEEKTAAILALRNVGLPSAAEKLLKIVVDKTQDKSVRVAAMAGLKPLLKADPKVLIQKLLPLFYDRSEVAEIRNNAVLWTLITSANEYTVNEVVIYMWSEKDPQVKNFLKTFLLGLADSTRPCISKKGSYAKTALQMFPKWEVQGKYSGNYMSDYYDRQYNFGHMTHLSVQKNGKSVLPSTLFIGLNGQMAGFGTSYLSAFLRLEGLGKSISSRIMSMTTDVVDFENIEQIFSKIGVQHRQPEPLRIEIAVFLHNRVVAYHAADQKTVTTVPQLIKKLGELKTASYDKEITRMLMLGGAFVEQPLDFGTPVSTLAAVTGFGGLTAKVGSERAGNVVSRKYDVRIQMNLHGIASVANHMPAFRSMHSVTAYRTLRARLPRNVQIGIDAKQMSLNFVVNAPTEEDPSVVMVHSTAVTSVHSNRPVRHLDAELVAKILTSSCPACKGVAIITKGDKYRETRQLGSGYKYKFMEGISAGAKYFDCEKIHSRIHVIRTLRKFFGPENKNLGGGRFGGPLTQIRLGLSYAIKSIFLSPPTETCGLKAYFKQDPKAASVFEKIEGQIKVKYESDPKEKIGTKVQAKSSLNLKYGGATPKTKTVDLSVTLQKSGIEKTELKVKLAARDEVAGRNGVVCLDLTSSTNKVGDFFDYEGENEPTYERQINIVWGKEDKAAKEGSCPTNSAAIKIVKQAHRSKAQIEEAKSDRWPYKQCRAQKGSAQYPGPLTPATGDCIWAAYKQTNLREANITINYKVDPEARKRWRYPGAIIAGLLMPYWVPAESVDADAAHHGHDIGPTADGKFIQGEIKLDVAMDEEHPEADIHFHSSQGEQEHFHGVDLNFLPGGLKRPIFSRFSPLYYQAMRLGVYSYCDVTPQAVQTYDNYTYVAQMSECPTLISGDCTDKPRYVVLGRKVAADKLAITVVMGEHKIELADTNTATVDGKAVPLSDKVVTNDGDTKLFKLFKHDANNVFIYSQKLSVFVRYTGYYTTVTAGSRYRDTQCGLCGNFDGCPENDLTGPDATCKGMGPNDMMKAYIVRDANCAGVGSPCPVSG